MAESGWRFIRWVVCVSWLLTLWIFIYTFGSQKLFPEVWPIIFVGFLIGNKCILYVILILIFCFCVNHSIDRNANWDHFQSGQCIFVFLGSTLFEVYFKGDISLRFPLCLVLVFPQVAGGPMGTWVDQSSPHKSPSPKMLVHENLLNILTKYRPPKKTANNPHQYS